MKNKKANNKNTKNEILKNEKIITKISREIPGEMYDEEYDDFEERFERCHICEEDIEEGSEYAYLYVVEGENYIFDDVLFCSRKCWKEHILREAKRIRSEKS